MRHQKLQSAMEYLMTYSWAIVIIAIVLGVMFALGIFNPNQIVSSQCVLPSGLSCPGVVLYSNGQLQLNLLQVTQAPINITALGCNMNNTVARMYLPYNPVTTGNQIKMLIGGNYSFSIFCWGGSSIFTTQPGQTFKGYLIVNYTESTTGFPHTLVGEITAKAV